MKRHGLKTVEPMPLSYPNKRVGNPIKDLDNPYYSCFFRTMADPVSVIAMKEDNNPPLRRENVFSWIAAIV